MDGPRPLKRRKGHDSILQPISVTKCARPSAPAARRSSGAGIDADSDSGSDSDREGTDGNGKKGVGVSSQAAAPAWARLADGRGWARLARWERSERPALLRRRAYELCAQRLEEEVERAVHDLYAPLLADVRDILRELAAPPPVPSRTSLASNPGSTGEAGDAGTGGEGAAGEAFVPVSFLFGGGALRRVSPLPGVAPADGPAHEQDPRGGSGLHGILIYGRQPPAPVFAELQRAALAAESREGPQGGANTDAHQDAHPALTLHAHLTPAESWGYAGALRLVLARLAAQALAAVRAACAAAEADGRERTRTRARAGGAPAGLSDDDDDEDEEMASSTSTEEAARAAEARATALRQADHLSLAASAGDVLAFADLLERWAAVEQMRQAASPHVAKARPAVLCVLAVQGIAAADQQCVADVLQTLLRCVRPDPLAKRIFAAAAATASAAPSAALAAPGAGTAPAPFDGRVLLVASTPSKQAWLETFPFDTLRLMDIEHLQAPSPQGLLATVTERLFISPQDDEVLPVGLSFDLFNVLRRIFEQSEGDIEGLASALRLAFLHHFSTEPLSALSLRADADRKEQPNGHAAKEAAESDFDAGWWTENFWTMVRVRFARDTTALTNADEPEPAAGPTLPGLPQPDARAEGPNSASLTSRSRKDLQAAVATAGYSELDIWATDEEPAQLNSATRGIIEQSRAFYSWHARARLSGLRIVQAIASVLFKLDGPAAARQSAMRTMWSTAELFRATLDLTENSLDRVADALEQEVERANLSDLRRALEVGQRVAEGIKIGGADAAENATLAEFRNVLERAAGKLATLAGRLSTLPFFTGQPAAHATLTDEADQRKLVADWCGFFLDNMLRPPRTLFALSEIFVVGTGTHIFVERQLLPTPRMNVQLALEAPELCFASMIDSVQAAAAADGKLPHLDDDEDDENFDPTTRTAEFRAAATIEALPDVAQAYALWLEVGDARIINLADWFSVFKQTVLQKRKRTGSKDAALLDGTGASAQDLDEMEEDAERERLLEFFHGNGTDASHSHRPRPGRLRQFVPDQAQVEEERELQARFAIAIFQLAKLGFIRSTTRKPEHVAKAIFDLPVLAHMQGP